MPRIVTVKGLLRCISYCDRVSPSWMTGRILTSTGSGDLISGLLDLGRGSFDLEVINLFPDGVYYKGGEGTYRLGVLVNCFLTWSPELILRTPQKGSDTIIFFCGL